MRILSTLLLLTALTLSIALAADDPVAPPQADPVYIQIEAAYRNQFKNATLLKVERKEKLHTSVQNMIMLFPGTTQVIYKLTLSDPLNKKFDVTFAASSELIATDKYRTTVDALPSKVQSAIEAQVPNAGGSTDPLDARLEKYVYKVSGKINGKKVNVEVNVEDKSAPPVPPIARTQPREPERKTLPPPEPPPVNPGKAEISAQVDGPFRALFRDATILRVDHKETPNVTIHVFSIGGGSKYELTLADDLNKKFKATFTDTGHLYNTSNYLTPFNRLPTEVQSAIEKVSTVPDPAVVLDVRVDHKMILQSEHEEYIVTGKINGVKISVDVPVYSK